jgi:hypothetical protein
MISDYFIAFDKILTRAEFINVSEIDKRKINNYLGIIEAELFFENRILFIRELIKSSENILKKEKYKYFFL